MHDDDADLTRLLQDAVDRVEPADRLVAIRQQTAQRSSRPRWFAVGGAVLATAAVVTGIAIAAQPGRDPGPGPGTPPTSDPDVVANPDGNGQAIPIYYIGDTPQGPKLFREFWPVPEGASIVGGATLATLTPHDPDYRTPWGGHSLTSERGDEQVSRVQITPELVDRPEGMSSAEAELAIQQVVYTVSAQGGPRQVEFLVDGQPATRVLGVPVDGPVERAPQLDVLALVNISDPAEGREVDGHFSANGVASSFEGTVHWDLRNLDDEVVRDGVAQGTMEDHLTPWDTGDIDVSDLPAGLYTFEATTDDPSGGEAGGPTVDTRVVIVR